MDAALPGGQMLSSLKTLEAVGYPLHGVGGVFTKKV
jgi:hypothetical protein